MVRREIDVEIRTTNEFLANRRIDVHEIQARISHLISVFGGKYERMFPLRMDSQAIDRVLHVDNLIRRIESVSGFDRHIGLYNKNTIDDHLFTARVAAWLDGAGLEVVLEPLVDDSASVPDLSCKWPNGPEVFIECKRIRTERWFDFATCRRIADLVFGCVETTDQISVLLHSTDGIAAVESALRCSEFVDQILSLDEDVREASKCVGGLFTINVVRSPIVPSCQSLQFSVQAEGWVESVSTGIRLPGYWFCEERRTVGVHGPPPCYRRVLDRKRTRSKGQVVPGKPYVLLVDADCILGEPDRHKKYIVDEWLSSANAQFSGVGILEIRIVGGGAEAKLSYFKNEVASVPLEAEYFDQLGSANGPL